MTEVELSSCLICKVIIFFLEFYFAFILSPRYFQNALQGVRVLAMELFPNFTLCLHINLQLLA